ncbi:unnamed protein product [Blumeria hordei]|uniref:Uncharacterized protein n=1 Tax=Blumeria hordei TaxID=2867405 RepID=A0A383UNV8_BLUHO|nr:unnamed protein product [Blumeria hordei]
MGFHRLGVYLEVILGLRIVHRQIRS